MYQVRNCALPWPGGGNTLDPITLPLDCFETGFRCNRETDCDTCVANGCGWCAEEESVGNTGKGACMEGNVWGPICGDCGNNCSCSWNYGKCPMRQADMSERKEMIDQHQSALANISTDLRRLYKNISGGVKFEVATAMACAGGV